MRPTTRDRLEHILSAIQNIGDLTGRCSLLEVEQSPVLRAAFERFLEIISEASRHVPQTLKDEEPTIAWRQIAGIGNVIRHSYDGVDVSQLWDIATVEIPALETAILRLYAGVDEAGEGSPRT